MFAGVSSSSQATRPNTEMRRRNWRWDSEVRLSRTIGFQAAVLDTSDGKHLESSHQLIVRFRCLRHIVTHR